MTAKDLETLADLVAEKVLRKLDARALPLLSKDDDECDRTKEERYLFTQTKGAANGEYKSPAQMARELIVRVRPKGSPKK